jgi:hypothetical protein
MLKSDKTFINIKNEIETPSDPSCLKYHMHVTECDNFFSIYTENISTDLHCCNKIIDKIIHVVNYAVFKKNNLKIVSFVPKINKLNNIDDINNLKLNNLSIYKNYTGIYVIFFKYNNIYYAFTKNNIFVGSQNENIINILYLLTDFDDMNIYHLIYFNNKLKQIPYYNESGEITNKCLYKLSMHKKDECENNQILDQRLIYGCFDEIKYDFSINENNNIMSKRILFGGYIIRIGNEIFLYESKVYRTLVNNIPLCENINICLLNLYCTDKLSTLLPFLSPYSNDIIKRINTSMKTISKEVLNIYHKTRNRQSSDLYKLLPNNYKKILYELHTIFVNSRKNEYDNHDKTDIIEKKSLSIEDVYKYIKKSESDIIISLYINRNELYDKLVEHNIDIENILYNNCVYTRTQTELMK